MPVVLSSFERFVAFRYLWGAEGREEGRSFLRFVIYVSVGGVAVGVAALLLALAIVRGFSQEITNKIYGFGAHIQVQSYVQDKPLSDSESLQRQLGDMEGVTDVSPVVQHLVLLRQSETSIDGVMMLGTQSVPSYMEGRVVEGEFRLTATDDDQPPIVIGIDLAERLGLSVGDRVTAFSLQNAGDERSSDALGDQRPRVRQFRVAGIYETALTNIDDTYIFTGLSEARSLAGMGRGEISRLDLTTSDISSADSLAADIENKFGFPISARTIDQIQPYSSLFAWVDLQQSIIPLVIGVIVIVAAFNIIGALLMMILEKTREIGVLQSLGASQRGLKRLFVLVGLLIGISGSVLGSGAAFSLSLVQQRFSIIPLPAEAYYMTTAPIQMNPLDYLLVNGIAIALCALAAYVPARVAARIEPVRAIRFQ